MEIIHKYNNIYPFGVQQATFTYIQISISYQDNNKFNVERDKLKKFKVLECEYFIGIDKLLKEDSTIHILYHYYPNSLVQQVKIIKNEQQLIDLIGKLHDAIKKLIHYQIKADLSLMDIAIDDYLMVKLFIHPSFEFFGSQAGLVQFYQAQQARLTIQIQQIYQQIHGTRDKFNNLVKLSNFIINGVSLVFNNQNNLNEQTAQKTTQSETKVEKRKLTSQSLTNLQEDNYKKTHTFRNKIHTFYEPQPQCKPKKNQMSQIIQRVKQTKLQAEKALKNYIKKKQT